MMRCCLKGRDIKCKWDDIHSGKQFSVVFVTLCISQCCANDIVFTYHLDVVAEGVAESKVRLIVDGLLLLLLLAVLLAVRLAVKPVQEEEVEGVDMANLPTPIRPIQKQL